MITYCTTHMQCRNSICTDMYSMEKQYWHVQYGKIVNGYTSTDLSNDRVCLKLQSSSSVGGSGGEMDLCENFYLKLNCQSVIVTCSFKFV